MLRGHPAAFTGVVPCHYIPLTWERLCWIVMVEGFKDLRPITMAPASSYAHRGVA